MTERADQQVEILDIHCFLTHPGKGETNQEKIHSARVPSSGRLHAILEQAFRSSEKECRTPICFNTDAGAPHNDVRDELLEVAKKRSIPSTKRLATRLQLNTTAKSGKGLLFVVIGEGGGSQKIQISRFPADEGIVADTHSKKLKVEFVEQLFLKSASSYKSVVYVGSALAPDFWDGLATDRQMSSSQRDIANYWISGFLQSDLKTTPKQGTKQIADALKQAIKKAKSMSVKQKISSSINLVGKLKGRVISPRSYCAEFGFDPTTTSAVLEQLPNAKFIDTKFRFDLPTFTETVSFRYVELDNGAILGADAYEFDKCFSVRKVKDGAEVKYSTQGVVVDEKLQKTR